MYMEDADNEEQRMAKIQYFVCEKMSIPSPLG